MIMFLIIQSMGYNSLSDVPQLVIIMLLSSFFGIRKRYPIMYGQSIFFIAYYVQFALTLKVMYGILSSIEIVAHIMKEKQSDTLV
jgi:hypothetical protein